MKYKDFTVTVDESRFRIPQGGLTLDLYESGASINDGTILGVRAVTIDSMDAVGIPTAKRGNYEFKNIPYNKKYDIVISGFGVTTQIPDEFTNIDVGLPINVTGADLPWKENTNVSIQSAIENLDSTSQIPRIVILEDDVSDLQDDVTQLQADTTNIYDIIGGIDTTSALLPRIVVLEDTTEEQQDEIDSIQLDTTSLHNSVNSNTTQINVVKADTTTNTTQINLIKTDTTAIHVSVNRLQVDSTTSGNNIVRIDNFLHSFIPDKVLQSSSDGTIKVSIITKNELEALDNISSNIQAQIDSIPDFNAFDANDGSVGQILSIANDGTNNFIVAIDNNGGSDGTTTPVRDLYPCYFFNAHLKQETGISGGKIRKVGVPITNPPYTGLTIADTFSLSGSAQIDVGLFAMQFVSDGSDQFRAEIRGLQYYYLWKKQTITVWYFDSDNQVNAIKGYAVFGSNFVVGDFDMDEGIIRVETYDSNWVLTNDILSDGVTVSIEALKQVA